MTGPLPLLSVNVLEKHFPSKGGLLGRPRGVVHAVDGVTFAVERGEMLSVMGESGCGKSTLGRLILRLADPTAGEVCLAGERIDRLSGRRLKPLRRIVLGGDVPSPIDPSKGCRFHTRCPHAFDRCRTEEPKLRPIHPTQSAACHFDALPEPAWRSDGPSQPPRDSVSMPGASPPRLRPIAPTRPLGRPRYISRTGATSAPPRSAIGRSTPPSSAPCGRAAARTAWCSATAASRRNGATRAAPT